MIALQVIRPSAASLTLGIVPEKDTRGKTPQFSFCATIGLIFFS